MGTVGLDQLIMRWNRVQKECMGIEPKECGDMVRNSVELDDQLDRATERKLEHEERAKHRSEHPEEYKGKTDMCEDSE